MQNGKPQAANAEIRRPQAASRRPQASAASFGCKPQAEEARATRGPALGRHAGGNVQLACQKFLFMFSCVLGIGPCSAKNPKESMENDALMWLWFLHGQKRPIML
jgi:hypothetical protein